MLPKDGYDVVISGVGGKFPEANNIEELQEKLFAKEDLVTVDDRRWRPGANNTPKASGKLLGENKFDASFYGVHRRLCMSAEPMMKLTVERCFEAMIDSGVNPWTLRGSNTAVIVANCNSESEIVILTHEGLVGGSFGILGHSQALIANRVSYFFNFTGPSYTINSSWTGGLAALEQAATLIRQGRASSALVTTAYIMFSPSVSSEYAELGVLTFDNKTRSFDNNADGFVRSDGVVTYFLQRKEDANRIYANVVNVDSKCLGGRQCSLITFDIALEQFLANFYHTSECDPADLAYLEPEGMAVRGIDTAELNSVGAVLCKSRRNPLLIGSVKSNVGHAHVSACFMSVAKAIIAMETGVIPPTLHYTSPNTDVPCLVSGQLKPVTEETPLPGDLVAVNNISISGTAGHLLLRRHNNPKTALSADDTLPRLVLVAARHEEGVKVVAKRIESMLFDAEYISLVNNIHKTNIPNYLWRSFTITPSTGAFTNYDVAYCDSEKQRPLWFMFSGMGSQWTGMGRDLMQIPVFAAAIEKCDKVLQPRGVDIKHILMTDDASVYDNILNCFVGIAAVQVGLVDVLRVVGAWPDGIIGHSAGELGCAYADGCLTAEQMVLAAWARGIASLCSDLPRGLMAAVGLGYEEVKKLLPASVDVACHNALDSCTISGPWQDMTQLLTRLTDEGVFVKLVSTGERAFHSRYIHPASDYLKQLLQEVIPEPKARSSKWISTSVPEANWNTKEAKLASAEYYTNNLINPVLFEEGSAFIPEDAIVLEVAPHGLMQAVLRRSLSAQCINIPLTSKTAESNIRHVLAALGKLYVNKLDLDINALYPAVQYPVSRGTPSLAPIVTWDHSDTWLMEFSTVIRMLTEEKSELSVTIDESCDEFLLWSEHVVEDEVVVPITQLLSYAWKVVLYTKGVDLEHQAMQIETAAITGRIAVKPAKQNLEVCVFRGSQRFEVCLKTEDDTFLPRITGFISAIKRPHLTALPPQTNGHLPVQVSRSELYGLLAQHGYQLEARFRAVKSLCVRGKDFEAVVTWTGNMVTFLDALFKLVIFVHVQSKQKVVEPNGFRRLIVDTPHFFELPSGTEIQVWYNSKTNVLFCEGLQLEGLTLSSKDLKLTAIPSLHWKSVNFVPYSENTAKLEEFMSLSAQLVAEEGLNSWANKVASFSTLELRQERSKSFPFTPVLQHVLKSLSHVSTHVQVKDLQKVMDELRQDGRQTHLVIGEYKTLLALADSLQDRGNIFYLTVVPSGAELEERRLQAVLSHQLGQGALVLLKKWTDTSKARVFKLDWMAGLRQFMSHMTAGQSVVVVSRHWQPRQALSTLAQETYAHQLRCVFLDKQAPQFSLTSPLFYKQLSLGLSVNVLSGRVWGSHRTLDLPNIRPETEDLLTMDSSLKNLQVSYIALNTKTFTLQQEHHSNKKAEMKYLDYCGTKRNGDRVMGVGRYDHNPKRVVPDTLLAWRLPSHWSMEEAVTVPVTYSLAYYSVRMRARLLKGESVLVHAGMSPLGQAAIAVALDCGADLYVTVCTEAQVSSLLTAFPQINRLHVIVLERCNFEREIKLLTRGEGVRVVVSCVKGKQLDASVRILGTFSRLVHLGDIDIEEREYVGTNAFLRYNHMYRVTLDGVVEASEEAKRELRMFVEEGIRRGVVRPLKHKTFPVQKASEALKNLQLNSTLEKTVLVSPDKSSVGFYCNPEDSFIIVGTKQGLWVDLAEWLLRNGARKLIVASLKQNMTTSICRKFNNLMTQHRATIVMTTLSRLENPQDAEQFMQEAIKMGPVAGVFCIFMEEKSAPVAHLDAAARLLVPQLRQFVCLLGGSASVCESRAQLGLAACLVHAESPLLKPQAVLPYLSHLLTDTNRVHTFLVSDKTAAARQKGMGVSLQEVKSYLPASLEQLAVVGESVSGHTELHELTTATLHYEFVRHQLLPVFLVPGTDCSSLVPLSRHLLHPAFTPLTPPCESMLLDSARLLLQQILKVQPAGPYNLVGESWSGALALQLATLLEVKGHAVELFLLDAAPATAQHWVKAFCHPLEGFSNSKFLMGLLNLPGNAAKQLRERVSWEEQVALSLQLTQCPSTSAQSVGKALTALRSHLVALLSFNPSEIMFKGKVHLFRTKGASDSDSCDLKKYCKKTPIIHIMEDETFEDMLKNPKTAATLNEDLIFSWML